ncbi:hypothetical protein CRG98_004186 [Punica granatum]|uniref:laccase n=1 Tax=Punica granatum TaxID=22663 RepID=A0A2I0L3Y1_PUNGR|nr:hypothetical protein CRG98_004186 [Punica granatum]
MESHTRIISFSWKRILFALTTFLVTTEVNILILSSNVQAEGYIHHLDFILEEKNYTRLCATKSMLVVNGMFPGPTIRVRRGDTVFVNAINKGTFGVTLHWHGVLQPRNPWSDGPEYITQCAIKPGSWFKGDVRAMVEEDLVEGVDLPTSDAYTINGQPGDFYPCSNGSTYRWHVDYGKTYLLKIVNAAMNAELFLGIAGHNLTIVGMDGSYVKPFVTRYIMISPGRTIDALLTANQTLGQYYIIARQFISAVITYELYDFTNVSAILQYNGDYTPPEKPEFVTLPNYYNINAAMDFTGRIRSLADEAHPIDVPMNITTKINISGVYTTDFPDEPPYFFDFTGILPGYDMVDADTGTRVKVLNYGEEVEIVFQGTNVFNSSVQHPMHLHGYDFYVVGAGRGNYDFDNDPKTYNLVDPPHLNTMSSPKSGWVAIRFRANNPGTWLLHCHLDRHFSWGMNTVLIVLNGPTKETSLREPPSNMPTCKPTLELKGTAEDKLFEG